MGSVYYSSRFSKSNDLNELLADALPPRERLARKRRAKCIDRYRVSAPKLGAFQSSPTYVSGNERGAVGPFRAEHAGYRQIIDAPQMLGKETTRGTGGVGFPSAAE